MKVLICALALTGSAALADDRLDGAAIRLALTGHMLTYDDGSRQVFQADGGTVYDNGAPSTGRWNVQGDRYCSVWPPSDRWACYDVKSSADGQTLTFVADDGGATSGRPAP